jgi:hypothetical protein
MWREGQMRKMNPISALAGVESPHCSNIPSFQFRQDAAWSEATGAWDAGQLCETKPIPPKRQDRQVLGGKGFMEN